MNIIEILKTDSISSSRIMLNTNFNTVKDNIEDIDKFFYIPENSNTREAIKLPAGSWVDTDEIRTSKIKVKNTLRFTIPNNEGEVTFFTVNTENGHILVLDDKGKLELDVNASLLEASKGNVNIQSVINELVRNKDFMTTVSGVITTKVLTSSFIDSNIVPRVVENPTLTAFIVNEVSKDISSALTAFLNSNEFKDKVNSLIDEHVAPTPAKYTVVANVNDSTMGYVTPATKEVEAGKTTSLKATAYTGFKFVNWSNGQTNSKITFTVNDNIELTAYFEKEEVEKYTLTAKALPEGSGTVAGAPEEPVDAGTSIELIAVPKEGYEFVNWTYNGEDKGKETALTWFVTEDGEIVANFKAITSTKYTIIRADGESYKLENMSTGQGVEGFIIEGESTILTRDEMSVIGTTPSKFILVYHNNREQDIEIKSDIDKAVHYIEGEAVLDITVEAYGTEGAKYIFTKHKRQEGEDGGGGEIIIDNGI